MNFLNTMVVHVEWWVNAVMVGERLWKNNGEHFAKRRHFGFLLSFPFLLWPIIVRANLQMWMEYGVVVSFFFF